MKFTLVSVLCVAMCAAEVQRHETIKGTKRTKVYKPTVKFHASGSAVELNLAYFPHAGASGKTLQHVTLDGKICAGTCKRIQCEGWTDSNIPMRSKHVDVFSNAAARDAPCYPSACERDCAKKGADAGVCVSPVFCCCLSNGSPKMGHLSLNGFLAIFAAAIYGKHLF